MPFIATRHDHGDTTSYTLKFLALSPKERRKEEEKERLKRRREALVARLKEIARG